MQKAMTKQLKGSVMNFSSEEIEKLQTILEQTREGEKHYRYHILPPRIVPTGNKSTFFYEKERLDYFSNYLDFKDKSILDIGCNCGFFILELLGKGASEATGYEGKKLCCDFVKAAAEVLGDSGKVTIHNEYFEFEKNQLRFDIGILFNVLHHLGDDYGDSSMSIENAKRGILRQLNSMSETVDELVFQIGFNWQGNIKTCLFEQGTKAELIQFISNGVAPFWKIIAIGIPEKVDGVVHYRDLSEENLPRDDSLGEFLNRPIFVMRSLKAPLKTPVKCDNNVLLRTT